MVPVPAARSSLLPLMLLLMIGALWGSFYALIKIGTTGGIAPSAYLFWFGSGAGTVLLVIAIVRRSRPQLGWAFFRYCLTVGLVRFGIANVVFYSTQKRLPLGVMALIMAMVPIFTQLISIATRLERLSWLRISGILCGFAGVVLIVAPKGSLPDPSLIEQYAAVRMHFDAMLEHYGTETGVRMARKHLGWYSKGLPASAEFRAAVNRETEAAKVRALLASFFLPALERQAA